MEEFLTGPKGLRIIYISLWIAMVLVIVEAMSVVLTEFLNYFDVKDLLGLNEFAITMIGYVIIVFLLAFLMYLIKRIYKGYLTGELPP